MEYLIVVLVAFFASLLTFFSGFGLGTLLTPVFLLFFPLPIAVAQTAIVHFLNNLFKFALMAPHVNRTVLLRFGLPAIGGAVFGAWLLGKLADYNIPLTVIHWTSNYETNVEVLALTMGILIGFFALFELYPALKRIHFHHRWLIPGGILSGFFGGLSGHQGALRSAFLIKAGLNKNAFIATGIAIALLVDIGRLSLYSQLFTEELLETNPGLIISGVIAAFAGALVGKRLLTKVTIDTLQLVVGILMLCIAAGLITGLL